MASLKGLWRHLFPKRQPDTVLTRVAAITYPLNLPLTERVMLAYNARGLAGYTASEAAAEIGANVGRTRVAVTRLFQSGKLRKTGSRRGNAVVLVTTNIRTALSGVPITAA